jgi:hypothetical protein
VSIPYQALHPVSDVIKQHIVRALETVADSHDDPRMAEACFELCVCYLGEFGIPILEESNQEKGMRWLLKAARLGNISGRSVYMRISQALQMPIPEDVPILDWLHESATLGSRLALETLRTFNPTAYSTAVDIWRSKSAFLHGYIENPESQLSTIAIRSTEFAALFLAASTGSPKMFDAEKERFSVNVINCQDDAGDTLIICASKNGRLSMIKHLADAGADGNICNHANENPLHFIGAFDEEDIPEASRVLYATGASPLTSAVGYTGKLSLDSRPLGKGFPALRAIAFNQPAALEFLLRGDSKQLDRPSGSYVRAMLSIAVLLYDVQMIQILRKHYGTTRAFQELGAAKFWRNRRLRNIAELCIMGPVSANPNWGYDLPDRFWRYINYGADHTRCLDETFEFLGNSGFDFRQTICESERNALFFAIKEGKRDAARWLMDYDPQQNLEHEHLYEVFGKKNQLGTGKIPPLFTVDTNYIRDSMKWAKETKSQDLNFQAATDMVLDYSSSGDIEDRSSTSTRALRRRDRVHTVVHQARPHPNITDHTKKEGMVDAVRRAIRCGHRGIFLDLILQWKGNALQRGKEHSVFICAPGRGNLCTAETTFRDEPMEDLTCYFPGASSRYRVTDAPHAKCACFEADCTLNYSLLYMTTIVRSVHRDSYFA